MIATLDSITENELDKFSIEFKPRLAKALFKTLEKFMKPTTEVKLHITKEGLVFCDIDSGHIGCMKIEINKEEFIEYNIKKEMMLVVSTKAFSFLIKGKIPTDFRMFSVDPKNDPENIYCEMENGKYTVELVECGRSDIQYEALEQTEYDLKEDFFYKDVEQFMKASKKMKLEYIRFTKMPDKEFDGKLKVELIESVCNGKDKIAYLQYIETNSLSEINEFDCIFYIPYLEHGFRLLELIKPKQRQYVPITIGLKYQTPLFISMNFGVDSGIRSQIYIAPRIEYEEDEDYED